jgi:hypothetical protein
METIATYAVVDRNGVRHTVRLGKDALGWSLTYKAGDATVAEWTGHAGEGNTNSALRTYGLIISAVALFGTQVA